MKKETKRFVFGFAILAAIVVTALFYFGNDHDTEFLIVDTLHSDVCEVYTMEGEYVLTYPYGYCDFLGNGHILGGTSELIFIKNYRDVEWKRPVFTDHDRTVANNHIYLLTRRVNDSSKKFFVHHRVFKLDMNGNIKFAWRVEEHLEELKQYFKVQREGSFPMKGIPHYYSYYLNSVLPVPEAVKERLRMRDAGELIFVSSWLTYGLFIVDTASSKVVWGYSLLDQDMSGPHTPFFNDAGELVFFINDLYLKDPQKNVSAIGIMDLSTRQLKTMPLIMNSKTYYTEKRGSLKRLKSGYILSFFDMGLILRLDKNFAFVSEHKIKTQNNQIYRARVVERSKIQFLLDEV